MAHVCCLSPRPAGRPGCFCRSVAAVAARPRNRRRIQCAVSDKAYKAGVDAFPRLVPLTEKHSTLPYMQTAREKLQRSPLKKLILFSDRDPVTWSQRSYFTGLSNVVADIRISDAGHFLQEDKGEELAQNILNNL
jgi:pimeloyl-ACP methyl ester carboxylesterase